MKLLPEYVSVNTKYHSYTKVPVVWDTADMKANYSFANVKAAEFKVRGDIDISGCEKLEAGAVTSTYITVRIRAHEHSYDVVKYTWSSDYTKCTAVASCSDFAGHKVTETVGTTYKTVQAPTAKKTGTGQYTAKFKNTRFKTQTRNVTEKYIAAPAKLTVKKASKSSIKLTWTKVSGAYGYEVYYKTGKGAYKSIRQ